jgi:hypothetical protein
LPIILKNERFRALFLSRFSPEITADDVEEPLKEKLSLKKLFFIRPKLNSTLLCIFLCFGN